MRSDVGGTEYLVVDVGRRHRDHIRIGGGILRRRLRPEVAGGRDQHRAFGLGGGKLARQVRVGRAGKAHVDDARLLKRGILDAFEDRHGGRFGAGAGGAERTDGEDLRSRRRAHQPRVGRDRASDGGAVLVRRRRFSDRVKGADDDTRKLGMTEVDAGIDHRDQHSLAGGERMRLADAKLAERILRGVADRRDRRRGRHRGRRLRGFW